nr:recombinase family protein [Pedobacter panaciterrae]
MDAIGYIRISKKDQSTHSLEYQEKNIKDYCDRNHILLGSLFVDDGESSYTFDRPDYKALETFIKNHKGKTRIKYLIVFDHDRFSRNLPEALQKIEYLEKKYGLKVIATSEPLDIDTSDPSVFLLRAFKYLIANQELLTIRKRAKESARHAQESGRYLSKAPYGYLNGNKPGGKRIIEIDDSTAYIVKKIFRDFLSGVPHFLIYKDARKLGFPLLGNSAIFRILNNPLYAGLVRVCASGKYPEKLVQGIHKPIITESQYFRTIEMLENGKRSMKSKPKDEFPLRGILKSPCCGTNMTAGWSKGKNKYYIYYRCIAHSNINISGAMIHERFDELLKHISFSQGFIDKLIIRVTTLAKETLNIRDKRHAILKNQLAALETKIEGAENKLFEETINDVTYKKWKKKFDAEKARLKDEFNQLEDLEGHLHQRLLVLPYMLNLPQIFKDSSLTQQHAIINEVFKRGLTFKNGAFRTPWINPEFEANLLDIKEKGLLFLEQPFDFSLDFPSGGGRGIRTSFIKCY